MVGTAAVLQEQDTERHHAFAGALAVDVAEIDCEVVTLLTAAQRGQALNHSVNLCPPGPP